MRNKKLVRMSARIKPTLMAAVKAAAATNRMTIEDFVAAVLSHHRDVATMYDRYEEHK